MEDDGDYSSPFWQPPATVTRRRHHRQPLSPFLNSSLFIILLPSLILLFIVFIFIPWTSKQISNYNKPITTINTTPHKSSFSIKKSWDSLNIVLVIFAILCGVFARRNDDVPSPPQEQVFHNHSINHQPLRNEHQLESIDSNPSVLLPRSKSSIPHRFEDSPPQRINNLPPVTASTEICRLRRTVSSDLYIRHYDTGNTQFRLVVDDLDVNKSYHYHPKDEEETQIADVAKEIPTETRDELPSPIISPPKTPPRDPPPPPPPPPPPVKQQRTFQTLPQREDLPPPPQPPKQPSQAEMKDRSSRKKMNATKEIATALVSLYSQRKRKRRGKSRKHCDESSEDESQSVPPPSSPKVFRSLFKKESKDKDIDSLSSPPTPPSPPQTTRARSVNFAAKPPLPRRRETGNESPMNGIPQPPPLPPFKVAGMKFPVVGGGYVRVHGSQSLSCESSELDGDDDAMSTTSSEMNGRDGVSRVTCPSPDVNRKADNFIARQQDGWRLEKINSWREKVNNKAGPGSSGSTSRPMAQ